MEQERNLMIIDWDETLVLMLPSLSELNGPVLQVSSQRYVQRLGRCRYLISIGFHSNVLVRVCAQQPFPSSSQCSHISILCTMGPPGKEDQLGTSPRHVIDMASQTTGTAVRPRPLDLASWWKHVVISTTALVGVTFCGIFE